MRQVVVVLHANRYTEEVWIGRSMCELHARQGYIVRYFVQKERMASMFTPQVG